MIITNLRCCLFTSPTGLHSRTPDFSWELSELNHDLLIITISCTCAIIASVRN